MAGQFIGDHIPEVSAAAGAVGGVTAALITKEGLVEGAATTTVAGLCAFALAKGIELGLLSGEKTSLTWGGITLANSLSTLNLFTDLPESVIIPVATAHAAANMRMHQMLPAEDDEITNTASIVQNGTAWLAPFLAPFILPNVDPKTAIDMAEVILPPVTMALTAIAGKVIKMGYNEYERRVSIDRVETIELGKAANRELGGAMNVLKMEKALVEMVETVDHDSIRIQSEAIVRRFELIGQRLLERFDEFSSPKRTATTVIRGGRPNPNDETFNALGNLVVKQINRYKRACRGKLGIGLPTEAKKEVALHNLALELHIMFDEANASRQGGGQPRIQQRSEDSINAPGSAVSNVDITTQTIAHPVNQQTYGPRR
jgi:hypothetical protein